MSDGSYNLYLEEKEYYRIIDDIDTPEERQAYREGEETRADFHSRFLRDCKEVIENYLKELVILDKVNQLIGENGKEKLDEAHKTEGKSKVGILCYGNESDEENFGRKTNGEHFLTCFSH